MRKRRKLGEGKKKYRGWEREGNEKRGGGNGGRDDWNRGLGEKGEKKKENVRERRERQHCYFTDKSWRKKDVLPVEKNFVKQQKNVYLLTI